MKINLHIIMLQILCLFILLSQIQCLLCHSSCDTCLLTNSSSCLSCNTTFFVANTSLSTSCIGIQGYTFILQKIDSSWNDGTTYLNAISTNIGNYTPTNTLGYSSPPLTIYQSGFGTTFIGFILQNLPINHYKIQIRTHGTFQTGTNCTWFQYALSWEIGVLNNNITDQQFLNVNQFNDTRTSLQIKYTAGSTQVCQSMTIVDVTIVTFICTNCSTCSSLNVCITCGIIGSSVYYLDSSNNCVQICLNNYYHMQSNYICDICDISCRACFETINNCTMCNIPGGYVQSYQNSSTCVTSCLDGQYKDSTVFKCLPCDPDCLTCAHSNISCLTCGVYFGTQLYLLSTICIYPCPAGTYPNSFTKTCISCDSSCTICFGSNNFECTSCSNVTVGRTQQIYYLSALQSQCSLNCPNGQFIDINIMNLCQLCDTNCSLCQYSSMNCTGCIRGYSLYNSSCISSCVSGTFNSLLNNCQVCDVSCATCFESTNACCFSCTNSSGIIYYLESNTTICTVSCPSGQFQSNSSNLCLLCAQQCVSCQIVSTNCFSCKAVTGNNYYLYSNSCLLICPSGTYQNDTDLTCYQSLGLNSNNPSTYQHIQGILFIILSTLLLALSVPFQDRTVTAQMLSYVQTIQIIRVREISIVIEQIQNVLVGFSYSELTFMPNPITNLIAMDASQKTSESAVLVYGSQNLIINFGSILSIVFLLQILLVVLYLIYRKKEAKILIIKFIRKMVIEYWITIILYGSILSISSLSSNNLSKSTNVFILSVSLSFILLLFCLIYFFLNVKHIIQKEFFVFSNFLKIISLIILGYKWNNVVLSLNICEFFALLAEMIFLRKQKDNLFVYLTQKLIIVGVLNCSLLAKDSLTFIVVSNILLSLIGCYKIYIIIKLYTKPNNKQVIQPKINDSTKIFSQTKIMKNQDNTQDFIYYQHVSQTNKNNQISKPQQLNNLRQSQTNKIQINPFDSIEQLIHTPEVKYSRTKRLKTKRIKTEESIVSNISKQSQVMKIVERQKEATLQQKRQRQQLPFAQFQQSHSELSVININ